MNARELYNRLLPMFFRGTEQWLLDVSVNADIILRSLALQAAVDDGDGLVRELRCMAADAIPESGIEQIWVGKGYECRVGRIHKEWTTTALNECQRIGNILQAARASE